ncbi:MAG: divergent polysaccharide deacetylase family protein [bacterium]
MNKFIERIRKNKLKSAVGGMLILVFILSTITYLKTPRFPDALPSSEIKEIQDQAYQERLILFQQFTRLLRENHGEMLIAEPLDKKPASETAFPSDSGVYTFRQQYKSLNQSLISDLSNSFALRQGMRMEIRSGCKDLVKTTACYEMDFTKAGVVWMRILLESQQSGYPPGWNSADYKDASEPDHQKEIIPPEDGMAKLAIVIDDLGYQMDVFNHLITLEYEITYSVLPQQAFSRETAEIATQAGRQVILHLPMQPRDWPKFDPGWGALLLQDSTDEVNAKMALNLSTVPFVTGVNNHMGSAYTQYAEGLDTVMQVLNEKGLFFLDSKTAPGNTAKQAALNHSVPYLSRDIFLDNDKDETLIQKQLQKAVRLAKHRGRAIAIGHPYAITYTVLAESLPQLKAQGVVVIKVSELLN